MMKFYAEVLLDAGLSREQIKTVQQCMAEYALAAVMDSSVEKEAAFLCEADLELEGSGG
jgi:hypothetical protein